MNKQKIKIGISLRVIKTENYSEKRDGLSQDWPEFFKKFDSTPIFIPNTLDNVESYLDSIGINGIILSGGDNIGDNPERDITETKLIQYGIDNDLPVFGVCRGMQMINHFFNGTIKTNSSKDHVNNPHKIKILNNILSKNLNSKLITVNSFHNNIINNENLGEHLNVFARALFDNTVEGIFHDKHKILGVMWHPEREQHKNDELILNYIFHDNDFWDNLT
jgi:N5-(cytidine 5'-diphosphoramidyl)-L-glutamine hydrolase